MNRRKPISLLAVICTISLLPSLHAKAEYAPREEALYSVDSREVTYHVRTDGSYDTESLKTMTLLKDAARDEIGNQSYGYSPAQGPFKIVYYRVSNGASTFEVDPKNIEDKASADSVPGFSSTNVVKVAPPQLEVGSRISIKIQQTVNPRPITGHFSETFSFGLGEYVKKEKVVVVSERPLFFWINDPQHVLSVQKSMVDKQYKLSIEILKPLYYQLRNEKQVTIDASPFPSVDVSTFDNWADAVDVYADAYEKISESALPPLYQQIFDQARILKTDEEKLNFVLAKLQEKIRYFGDWRETERGTVPHSLDEITNATYADCKDLAISAVSIFRRLGFESHVALIERGVNPRRPARPEAIVGRFNHAITWVKTSTKSYWLDPTNSESFLGIYPDIMGRQAIIVIPGHQSRRETTPFPDPSQNLVMRKREITPLRKSDASIKMILALGGSQAAGLTGFNLNKTREQSDLVLMQIVTNPDFVTSFSSADYDLRSRIVTPLKFSMEFESKNFFMLTSAGKAFQTNPPELFDEIIGVAPTRVSDLFLGMPRVMVDNDSVKGFKLAGNMRPNCWIDTPWVSISKVESQSPDGLKSRQAVIFKTDRIPAKSFGSPEFKGLQRKLVDCFDSFGLVLQPIAGSSRPLSK